MSHYLNDPNNPDNNEWWESEFWNDFLPQTGDWVATWGVLLLGMLSGLVVYQLNNL